MLRPFLSRARIALAASAAVLVVQHPTIADGFAFAVFGRVNATTGLHLGNTEPVSTTAYRWDAIPFAFPTSAAVDRSLHGGLTYNLEANMRTNLTWNGAAPAAGAFNAAVTAAFGMWSGAQPILAFNQDAGTAPVVTNYNGAADNVRGTDIDIISAAGVGALGVTDIYGINARAVTLTRGQPGYTSSTICASDITLDRAGPSGTGWTISTFQFVLAHEIGHALGLGDIETRNFWDTNVTINDVMAINLNDPINTVGLTNFGVQGPIFGGHVIVMETATIHGGVLANDDIAGLNFLYPVPEPSALALLSLAILPMVRKRRA